ncbi:MAG: hypothetical protein J7L55_01185, partial [Desulfurococcales archaeon]|nr:hypothetical protein [Desulfurococcales archaeon]
KIPATAGPDWGDMVKAFSLYNLKNSTWSNTTIVNASINPPTFVFYQNATANRIVSGVWQYGNGYIVVNDLPPLDWNGTDPHGTSPDFDATLAVFVPLYIWLATKS